MIDVRGQRVGAAITTVVLGGALLVQGPIGTVLVAVQWLVFAIATVAGPASSPYGALFRVAARRLDLGPPPATEPVGPARFAQGCGLAVTTVALVAFASGAPAIGWVAVAVVLALSTLLATTGLCIGCELYLVGLWWRRRDGRLRAVTHDRLEARDLSALGLDLSHATAGAVLLGSPTCSPCTAVKRVLTEVAAARPGFRWVEVDAADHLVFTHAHRVLRVPTLFVVDPGGRVLARTGGVPEAGDLVHLLDQAGRLQDVAV